MAAPTVAIIAPGAMGAAVGRRMVRAGCRVLTSLEGRSPSSAERAKAAGMEDASLLDIARRADWVLSIIPPSSALAFAERFKAAHAQVTAEPPRGLAFVDCNAVSPETAKCVARVFDGSTVRFVDAGIVGGPPSDGYDPAFYASADPTDVDLLDQFVELGQWGLKVEPLRGNGAGIGAASAVKMSHAGITKGLSGLLTTMILAAHASSPATAQALIHSLSVSQPAILQRMTTDVPSMLPKAYRWVGEMEEVSSFIRDGLGEEEAHIHRGFARLYERIESGLPEGEDIAVLKKFVESAKKTIHESAGRK